MFDAWKDVMRLAFRPLPPFTYSPLPANSIRLLTPCSSTGSDGYAWRLEIVDLDQPDLIFDALSYTWGLPNESYPITCNAKLLFVHKNLYSALPCLARREGNEAALPIWIDAICLDQSNHDEKAAQIPLMNHIYRKAEIVWVWLGLAEHQDQVETALQLLLLIAVAGQESRQFERDFGERRDSALNGLDASIWSAVLHLTNNDWFRRVWVMQEAALAQNLIFMCGHHQITCEQIRNAISDMVALGATVDSEGVRILFVDHVVESDAIFHIRDMVQSYMRMGNPLVARTLMLDILSLTASSHQCSQAQDRVFGLLGLVDRVQLQSAGIGDMPSGDITIEMLYTWFSRCLLTDTHTHCPGWYSYFDLAADTNPGRNETLPSWVPDLHRVGPTASHALRNRVRNFEEEETPQMLQASSSRGKLVRKGTHLNQIIVEGRILDEVTVVYDEIPTYPKDSGFNTATLIGEVMQYLATLLDWEERLSDTLLGDWTKLNTASREENAKHSLVFVESYWQMLHWDLKDAGPTADASRRYQEFRTSSRRFLQTAIAPDNSTPDLELDVSELISLPIESRLGITVSSMKHLQGRQLFHTQAGAFGYTKKGVQAGDMVCLLTGLPVFHVLRKAGEAEDGEQSWKIVGDAYLQGLMNGEVDEMDIDVEDVVLV